jgi:hypothetical protein
MGCEHEEEPGGSERENAPPKGMGSLGVNAPVHDEFSAGHEPLTVARDSHDVAEEAITPKRADCGNFEEGEALDVWGREGAGGHVDH